MLGVLAAGGVVVFYLAFDGRHSRTARLDGKYYEEHALTDKDTRDKIVAIEVAGIITSHDLDGAGDLVERVKDQLELAEKDEQVKAVILKVDSPGGEVLASDEIFQAIQEFQTRSEKPVVAQMGSLAASGGYYVSAPCRWIVANELTLTGSIGVIMSGMNFRGLMDKVGIRPEVYKSGKFKDMMSSTRRPEDVPAGEREMMQALIDETYATFKGVVRKGREASRAANKKSGHEMDARELASDWESYADGRIFSGKEAHRLGFVDELGNFDVAVKRAKKLAGITEANIVKYQQPFAFGNLLRFLGKSGVPAMKVDLGFDFPRLQAGRMYFLSFNVVQ
ncbi:MAG: signal peptide peptidase SppA [Verrucomicrobia bacterium]|nr:signal peptide peptidase SppA [Verrucomicrobiota bacterium]